MKRVSGAMVAGAALACAIGLLGAVNAPARDQAIPRGGKVVAKVPIPAGTGAFAVGEGAVWAVSDTGPVLTRIDPDRNAVVASIKVKLDSVCPARRRDVARLLPVTAGSGLHTSTTTRSRASTLGRTP